MVLVWMVYAAVLAGLVGLAALAAERALRLIGLPSRRLWTWATAASLALPALAWISAGDGAGSDASLADVGTVQVVGAPVPSAEEAWSPEAWSSRLAPLDRPAGHAWGATAGLLLLFFAGASLRLARSRKGWGRTDVEGGPVRVSGDVGPAVVGLLRPEVVLPAWALEIDASSRRWIVLHEREHVRARDPLRVTASLLAAVLLPWNLPLWWQLRRLRQAVEIDCDGRVLRGAGRHARKRYGRLLLEVGRRGSRSVPVPAAFAETSSFLERRIRSMTESGPPAPLRRATVPAALAAFLLLGSCMAPGPDRRASPTAPELPMEVEEVPVDLTRPEPADEAELARAPTFTPYTVPPSLRNVEEVRATLEQAYPPLLRDAGIGGRALVYFFIDQGGTVLDVRMNQSSGHEALDRAALRVADVMEFTPALNRDEPVPVWISLPITFGEPTARRLWREDAEEREVREPPAEPRPEAAAPPEPREPPAAAAPAERPPRADLAERPVFTPYTRPPALSNEPEVQAALEREHPPLLRDAGIGGKVLVYFFVDEEGTVRDVRMNQSSGHEALDAAALRVARVMEFGPAFNRDDRVPVWISLPITFEVR